MGFLSVKHISFTYPGADRKTLDDISFEIEKGSYTAVAGTNGSGKSTMAKIICGLLEPDSGTVEIQENCLTSMVLQSPDDQIVRGTVAKDTEFGPKNLGLSAAEVELRTIESLGITGILDRAQSPTSALSSGQQQKTAFSGIIAMRPRIMILDEAVSMMDPESRAEIFSFLRYWHGCGNTIIHITHDLEAVAETDNTILIEKGKLVYYGRTQEFLKSDELREKVDGTPLAPAERTLNAHKFKSEPSLVFCAAEYSYDGIHGISGTDAAFYPGTLTALTGASGSGKSTLLELAAGLAGCQKGSVMASSRPLLARQNSRAALFETFAADDVAFGARNTGLSGKKLVESVKSAMEEVSLPYDEFGGRQTFCLSGGEQRRLSVAGILSMNPEIIMFDEPTAGLDGKNRIRVMSMMRKLADSGKTVIFSTHRRDEASFSDREIVLQNGRIVLDTLRPAQENPEKQEFRQGMRPVTPSPSVKILESLRKFSESSAAKNGNCSPVTKIPSVLKILLFLALFSVSLAVRPVRLCAVMTAVSAVYCVTAGFPLRKLTRALLKLLPFLLIFSVFQIIFAPAAPGERMLTEWRWFTVTPSKLLLCLSTILRTAAAVGCISAFSASTQEQELTDGVSSVLRPLAALGIPVRYLVIILEIIFRFIPLLVKEAASILKTQIVRGGLDGKKGKFARIKAAVPLAVPLILRTIKRSEILADAMTIRAFR